MGQRGGTIQVTEGEKEKSIVSKDRSSHPSTREGGVIGAVHREAPPLRRKLKRTEQDTRDKS